MTATISKETTATVVRSVDTAALAVAGQGANPFDGDCGHPILSLRVRLLATPLVRLLAV